MRSVRAIVMDLLARREHSRSELVSKLAVKGCARDEIEIALDKLAKEGLQSDERFAQNYIHSRVRSGFGPKRIEMELQQKGVSSALITACLQNDEIDWQENLQAVWQKKFAALPVDAKDYGRQLRFLMQRGFEAEQIHTLLKSNTVGNSDAW